MWTFRVCIDCIVGIHFQEHKGNKLKIAIKCKKKVEERGAAKKKNNFPAWKNGKLSLYFRYFQDRYCVHKICFEKLIDEHSTYKDLLSRIKVWTKLKRYIEKKTIAFTVNVFLVLPWCSLLQWCIKQVTLDYSVFCVLFTQLPSTQVSCSLWF